METSLTIISESAHIYGSHSLGTLIEWKQFNRNLAAAKKGALGSHSLGTLIEWKLYSPQQHTCCRARFRSHSLGTLIEWKHLGDFPRIEKF